MEAKLLGRYCWNLRETFQKILGEEGRFQEDKESIIYKERLERVRIGRQLREYLNTFMQSFSFTLIFTFMYLTVSSAYMSH